MEHKFKTIIGAVASKFECSKYRVLFKLDKLPKGLPEKGIYIFYEGERVLYVGRSNNIKKRLRYHLNNSHYQATFAFLLAREESGCLKPSYKKEGSRSHLFKNIKFRECFDAARNRISKMSVRVIEEADPTKQALLEIYAAVATGAKYSTFDNH